MLCINCGEKCRTSEVEGTIHESGLYACFPRVRSHDPKWQLVAESAGEFSEDGDWNTDSLDELLKEEGFLP